MSRHALVTLDFPPGIGGIQTYLWQIGRRLADLTVVAPRIAGSAPRDEEFPHPIVRVRAPPGGWAAVIPLAVATARRLRPAPPSVLVVGHLKLAPAGRILARLLGCRVVVATYGMEITCGRLKGLERWGLAAAARVVAIARFGADRLERLGVPAGAIRIVPPGIDPAWAVRPVEPDRPRILTVGRVEAGEGYKGHDRLAQALVTVAGRFPDLEWLVVGSGSGLDRLRALVGRLGLDARVRFTGPVDEQRLRELYASCTLFAMPARVVSASDGDRFEGFGIVYLEAALCARAVVAGRASGAPDAVVDGQTGRLVDGDDPGQVAGAITELLADRDRRQTMGERARMRVLDMFTWDRSAAAFASVLEEVS